MSIAQWASNPCILCSELGFFISVYRHIGNMDYQIRKRDIERWEMQLFNTDKEILKKIGIRSRVKPRKPISS